MAVTVASMSNIMSVYNAAHPSVKQSGGYTYLAGNWNTIALNYISAYIGRGYYWRSTGIQYYLPYSNLSLNFFVGTSYRDEWNCNCDCNCGNCGVK